MAIVRNVQGRDVVQKKLSLLNAKRLEIETQLKEARRLKRDHRLLSGQIELLRSILHELDGIRLPQNGDEASAEPAAVEGTGKGPTEAVLELLAQKPGLSTAQVIQELESVIASASTDRKRVLHNTLFNLVRRRSITRDDDGNYRLLDTAEQVP